MQARWVSDSHPRVQFFFLNLRLTRDHLAATFQLPKRLAHLRTWPSHSDFVEIEIELLVDVIIHGSAQKNVGTLRMRTEDDAFEAIDALFSWDPQTAALLIAAPK